jgi:hypothetical protein
MIMRPKYILWIAVAVVSSSWYALDPAAHPMGDALAKAPSSGVGQIAGEPSRAVGIKTAAL